MLKTCYYFRDGNEITLEVKKLKLEDAGVYMCKIGEAHTKAQLTVEGMVNFHFFNHNNLQPFSLENLGVNQNFKKSWFLIYRSKTEI